LEYRATERGFSVIAQYFGTTRVATLLARISRGILRAMALERVLLARAARGRDLVCFQPRRRPEEREDQPQDGEQQQQQQQQQKKPPQRRPAREPLPEFPSLEQLVEDTRRHPVGRAIADICRDLGVSSGLCEGWFGTVLLQAMSWYRGNFTRYYKDIQKREREFAEEWDKDPTGKYDWPVRTSEGVRRVLGFFIGENALKPGPAPLLSGLALAAATGPPGPHPRLFRTERTGPDHGRPRRSDSCHRLEHASGNGPHAGCPDSAAMTIVHPASGTVAGPPHSGGDLCRGGQAQPAR
ncbi:MAG TPA: hypothetical protein VFN42_14630, partial [Acetobacteraceae bacterium]|nr:hypothetical protein [Acetobacteraceae bacterium]